MATVTLNMSGHSQSPLTRSLEKILEEAVLSGELKLSGRKLKDFPKIAGKYNLADTVVADLSKNRFSELPNELTDYASLERLDLYHNMIRSISDTVIFLQSLVHLDLSRNQLSVLPAFICKLPLKVLIASNNKLVSLPEDIDRMVSLMELDVSCNELAHLPVQIGLLDSLRSLNLRRNLLVELPYEITHLHLVKLDISGNRISNLPVDLRHMTTLVELNLNHNPLISPPAHLCTRGRVHVFKYLEIQAIKEVKKQASFNDELKRSFRNDRKTPTNELRYVNGFTTDSRRKRRTADSGYSTSDGADKRWSQEMRDPTDPEEAHRLAVQAAELNRDRRRQGITRWASVDEAPHRSGTEIPNGTCSGSSTPSTLSPGNSMNLEEELAKTFSKERFMMQEPQRFITHIKDPSILDNDLRYSPASGENSVLTNGAGVTQPPDLVSNLAPHDDKKQIAHTQTYREYKEALRQQRALENGSAYRSKSAGDSPASESPNNSKGEIPQYTKPSPPSSGNHINAQQDDEFRSKHKAMIQQHRKEAQLLHRWLDEERKRLEMKCVQKEAVRSYVKSRTSSKSSSPESSPVTSNAPVNGESTTPSPLTLPNGNSYGSAKSVSPRPLPGPVQSPFFNNHMSSPRSPASRTTNSSPSPLSSRSPGTLRQRSPFFANDKKGGLPTNPSFTMRREYERQREEAEQIELLRHNIESRLKVSLPEDLPSALIDGVVLCHLANHVRPRSVASIHVPSPAVPKLTMAKCRRNVENFLDACRRIGVEEMLLCTSGDVLEGKGLVRVSITVTELLQFHQGKNTVQSVV